MNKCARCNKSGLQSACKECEKSRIAKANDKKEAIKPNHTEFKCAKCEIIKPVFEFYRNKTNRGHDSVCSACRLSKVKRSEPPKELPKQKKKIWVNPGSHDDLVNSAREASVYDLSIAMLVKIGDERRFKKGLERMKKSGVIKNVHIARPTYSFKNGVWSVVAEIRADGVLFPYKSQGFISKEIAEKHLNHVRENVRHIIEQRLKEAA